MILKSSYIFRGGCSIPGLSTFSLTERIYCLNLYHSSYKINRTHSLPISRMILLFTSQSSGWNRTYGSSIITIITIVTRFNSVIPAPPIASLPNSEACRGLCVYLVHVNYRGILHATSRSMTYRLCQDHKAVHIASLA